MPNKVPFQLSKRARFCPKVLLTIHMLPCIHIPAINVRDLEKTYDDVNLATNLKCNFIGQRCISRYFNSNDQMQAATIELVVISIDLFTLLSNKSSAE